MLPSGVSMLWESCDPEPALRERFGFDGLDAVAEWVTAALAGTWDVTVRECPRLAISDQNVIAWAASDRGDLVVKWSRDTARFARLDTSTSMLRTLDRRGVPVAAPLATRDGRERVVLAGPLGDLSVTVLPELHGDWLDVGDLAAVHSAGAWLAKLHAAFPPAPGGSTSPLRPRLETWLETSDRGLVPTASARLSALLTRVPPLEDAPQFVHNDFRAANLLTRDSEVVGVLDFDEVAVDHRVGDLAKACVYLGTRFTDWRPTPPAVRTALREGYESVRPLSPGEAHWLEVFVLWQALMAVPGPEDPGGWAAAV
ncbi:phosphotransferase [Kineococcus sp. NBC_00420]|uniref:phosphotransferase enzyme family protein n=1 Tax=Kineococcus sp. NBC_00420 TaxID=2903564 RepID=UPI002E2209D9